MAERKHSAKISPRRGSSSVDRPRRSSTDEDPPFDTRMLRAPLQSQESDVGRVLGVGSHLLATRSSTVSEKSSGTDSRRSSEGGQYTNAMASSMSTSISTTTQSSSTTAPSSPSSRRRTSGGSTSSSSGSNEVKVARAGSMYMPATESISESSAEVHIPRRRSSWKQKEFGFGRVTGDGNIPPSPSELRAVLTGNVMPDKRTSEVQMNVEKALMGSISDLQGSSSSSSASGSSGSIRYGPNVQAVLDEKRRSMAPHEPAIPENSTLLPAIGFVERRVTEDGTGPDSVPSPTTQDAPAPMAIKAKRRRASVMRRASSREIQYFTSLLKQTIVGDEKPAALTYDDAEIMREELKRMQQAEAEQCRLDRFWAFEYEMEQEAQNLEVMFEEDRRSRVHQDELKLAQKWELWTEWDTLRRKEEARHTATLEQKRRKVYLRDFYDVDNSGCILNYRWPRKCCVNGRKDDVEALRRKTSTNVTDPQPAVDARSGYKLDTIILNSGQGSGNGRRLLGTFHTARKCHQLMQASAISDGSTSPKRGLGVRRPRSASQAAPEPLACVYGSDEQSILKALFDSIDTHRQGHITREEFMRAVRHDHRTRELLQRTFLWSLYKARKWPALLELFEPDPVKPVTFLEVYNFVQRCQLETHVPPELVRPLNAQRGQMLDSRLERPLCRHEPGTRVKFLFQKGPIWQPGRVVRANKDGTYDVRCDSFDMDVVLKIQSPPLCSNQATHDKLNTVQLEDPSDLPDERRLVELVFEDARAVAGDVRATAAGDTKVDVARGERQDDGKGAALIPADAVLKALRALRQRGALEHCHALAAIDEYPLFAGSVIYMSGDQKSPGLSSYEWRAVVDYVSDLVSMNDLRHPMISGTSTP